MHQYNQGRTSAFERGSADDGQEPRRGGDHGLGIPPSNAVQGPIPVETKEQPKIPDSQDQRQTPIPDQGSVSVEKALRRDSGHGGIPPSTARPGRELSPKEVKEHDRREEEQEQEETQQEIERRLLRKDGEQFRLPAPILNFLSWVFLAAASILGLLLIVQGAVAVGHIQALPSPINWVAGVAASGFALVLVVLTAGVGWKLMRLRRSPAVNLAALRTLNERQRWQQLAIHFSDRARDQLQQYLEQYESEAPHPHLSDDERTRLKNARQYLLEGSRTLSAPEWLDVFSERFQSILDVVAKRRVRVYASKVGIGTAASRFPLLDQAIVLSACMAMLRELLVIYGLRPTAFQSALLLARSIMATYLSGVLQDATDNLVEDIVQDITEGIEPEEVAQVGVNVVGKFANLAASAPGAEFVGKVAGRASEGALLGVIVWRIGNGAIKQIQPVQSAK